MLIKINVLVSFVLCTVISATALAGAFQDNGNGTVTDFATGLIWQQSDAGIRGTHAVALTYCAGLSLGGSSDWRLPEIKELLSLSEYNNVLIAIDRIAFPTTRYNFYWSATSRSSNSNNAWFVRFGRGGAGNSAKTNENSFRCVRSMQ